MTDIWPYQVRKWLKNPKQETSKQLNKQKTSPTEHFGNWKKNPYDFVGK